MGLTSISLGVTSFKYKQGSSVLHMYQKVSKFTEIKVYKDGQKGEIRSAGYDRTGTGNRNQNLGIKNKRHTTGKRSET